jgi:hypothetical protein
LKPLPNSIKRKHPINKRRGKKSQGKQTAQKDAGHKEVREPLKHPNLHEWLEAYIN